MMCLTSGLTAAQQSGEERFRAALIEYFKPYQFFPVIVNLGYGLGDVIDIDGVTLLYRGSSCFPTLRAPTPRPQPLPDFVEVRDVGMSFGLRLRRLFDSSADIGLDRAIRIRFDDATVVVSTLADLRKTYSKAACPVIAPLLDGMPTPPPPGQHPYFIVGAVMYGKHEASLHSAGNGSVQASLHKVVSAVADASLKVNAQGGDSISLSSVVQVPIAIRPVTVPGLVKVGDFEVRGKGGVNPGDRWQWQANECPSSDTSCTQRFAEFAQMMARTPVVLSNAKRDE